MPLDPLKADILRHPTDPASLGFSDTSELTPADGLIGQDRALDALRFGVGMTARGYNIYALGAQGSGRHNAVRRFVEAKAAERPAPDDWVYLHNFEEAHRPKAIRLDPGQGAALDAAMDALVDQLKTGIRAVFESEDYSNRRQAIEQAMAEAQQGALQEISRKAEAQGLRLIRQEQGMAIVPLADGEPMTQEAMQALPEEEREAIQAKMKAIWEDLAAQMRTVPMLDKTKQEQVEALDRETAAIAVNRAFEDRLAPFMAHDGLKAHFAAMQADIIDNPHPFIAREEGKIPLDQHFNRYRANALLKRYPGAGAPVVYADFPDIGHLLGRIEHVPHMGAMLTDFTLIKPGALHRANGGYLLVDAERLLTSPMAWETLKRRLRAQEIVIESPASGAATMTTVTLEPEPIPLDVKVVLFGGRALLSRLAALDPDFRELFKVAADFDDVISRDPDCERAFCRLLAGIAAKENTRAIAANGCAAIIEHASRLAGDSERLTLQVRALADLVREADYWATEAGADLIEAAHISRAVSEQIRRVDLIRDKMQERITRETITVETSGARVGQINGLAVLSTGGFAFGKPSRITARVRMGAGKLVDIEREVDMGGPLHSKGVLILSSFLAARYALDAPMALHASLVFEQSYGGVDGDSASSTELYALLSALSGVPIKQGLAVTGSVSQNGEVQAIGGANEKIEGFFDICAARGLTGEQGALIPASNVKHLMLREDVAQACANGVFRVFAVSHIDEGVELLTGIEAGARGGQGRFPDGSINRLVEDRLLAFAEARRDFNKAGGKEDEALV